MRKILLGIAAVFALSTFAAPAFAQDKPAAEGDKAEKKEPKKGKKGKKGDKATKKADKAAPPAEAGGAAK
jgi:hypothetical protein